ncbi:nonsense-mediated mRNA decay factor SMG8 [Diorhabda sublineata]|uniref:nonsense-mediated mRNA decay factor SMG8 n=1 Tax=Diorhabda sublineata TaxID=1163346 RepID=UPI0024E1195E|nr:nonsense-mediated mRNA decay factor SMG8 [Diorhabda sublineata]
MRNTFFLPNLDQLFDVSGISCDKIVVVSIIGKSSYNSLGLKVKSIGRVISSKEYANGQECVIEGSYDEENQIVYLHMCTPLDADYFVKEYSNISKKCEILCGCDDFLAVYDEIKSIFARYLVLLFHISHIVILSHPVCNVDTNYIQYFKAVDLLSQKVFEKIVDILKSIDTISQEWVSAGRFCTPRLIFYFEKCPSNITNIKKLEHNLEDKIYFVLKKTRIISTSGCSLFSIPPNNEFVYIEEELGPYDKLGNMVRNLLMDCQPGGALQLEVPYSSQPNGGKNFKKFMHVHIQQARTKGFDDTVSSGRHQHSQNTHFELPVLKQWIEATKAIYKFMSKCKLVNSLCTDTRFSEQRCLKVLPLALARYQEGLPSHYAKAEHKARLSVALSLFKAQARGPVFDRYAAQLEMDCKIHWKNGRQQCEVASLTGNPCKLIKHSSDQEHMSGFIYKAICDCGRKVGAREDPYKEKQANYTFYQQISKECQCSKLERIQFPVLQSTSKFASETDEISSSSEKCLDDSESSSKMLTLNSPIGMLPSYSSWSLVCLGASSLYSHNLGLSESHHPGFLSSTNYLLPWDVTVFSESKQNWPHVNKYTIRGRRGRSSGSLPQFTVKVFIGVEYECSSGHRFMLSSPDRMLKAMSGGIVKDTGYKVAESDMPLYFPCACRAGKLAQLMRLHVVTPKAPVHCTLNPKVQPATGAPVFIPTLNGPTKLTQSAYWIMRLPYVYISEKEHYGVNPAARLLQGVFGVTEMDQ